MLGLLVYRQISQFVDDEAIELKQLVDLLFQLALEFDQFQYFHHPRQCKADFVAGVDGFQANPDGKVRLVDARRTDEDDIVPVVDKAEVEQTVDLPFADGGLEPVIEHLQAFVQRKSGPSPVLLDTLAVALLLFMLDQAFGKMQIGAFIGFGLAQ